MPLKVLPEGTKSPWTWQGLGEWSRNSAGTGKGGVLRSPQGWGNSPSGGPRDDPTGIRGAPSSWGYSGSIPWEQGADPVRKGKPPAPWGSLELAAMGTGEQPPSFPFPVGIPAPILGEQGEHREGPPPHGGPRDWLPREQENILPSFPFPFPLPSGNPGAGRHGNGPPGECQACGVARAGRAAPGAAIGRDWRCRCWGESRPRRPRPRCGPTRCNPPWRGRRDPPAPARPGRFRPRLTRFRPRPTSFRPPCPPC